MVSLALGVAAGLFFGEIVAPLKVVGDIFIRLLQITVIPYIVVALITGLGRLNYQEVKALALKGGGILLLLWGVGVTLVVLMPLSFPDWPSGSFFQKSSIEPSAAPDFLTLYIPSNPFYALANALVPAIVVFSILVGLALAAVPKKDVLLEPLSALAETLMRISSFISKLAPVGVFALIASAAGTMSFEDLARLQVWVVNLVLIALILGLWVLPALISCVTPLHYRDILRLLRTPLVTAFATGSSLVVLPLLAENCKALVAEARTRTRLDTEESKSSLDVLIPTFYSFPTVGNVLVLGFVLFSGWYIGSPVSLAHYPAVIMAGIASLFGGAVLTIPFVLQLAELPRDLLQVFLSLDVIGGRFVTLVSAMHYATIALIGTFALQRMTTIRLGPLLRVSAISAALFIAVLAGVHTFYTHVVVVPYTKNEALRGRALLRHAQPSVVHLDASAPPAGKPRTYAEILESGVLRACYVAGNYPLSFFNARGELVGFDIEMAHRLAERLGLSLEFLPLPRLDESPARLAGGYCDAVINSVAMDLGWIDSAAQTSSFKNVTIALLVPDHRRDAFATWSKIEEQGRIDIVTSAFQTLPHAVWTRLPEADVVRLSTLEEHTQFFESGGDGADAFLDTAEEGAAWTVLFPSFTTVVPRPVIQVPVVYLVARDNESLLRAMNAWLQIESATGSVDALYDYWIQGWTQAVEPPRWSVVRNVLHWIE